MECEFLTCASTNQIKYFKNFHGGDKGIKQLKGRGFFLELKKFVLLFLGKKTKILFNVSEFHSINSK